MQAEQWEEVKRIFESALEVSQSRRQTFVAEACGDRAELCQTVVELLQSHQEADGFLEPKSRQSRPVFQTNDLVAQRFRVIRFIEDGGQGEVYEVFDERLSVRLALKTLRSEWAADAAALERFRREIRVTRDFGHANLCRIYDLVEHQPKNAKGEAEGAVVTCLTMQLMSGENLKQYRDRLGPIPLPVALAFIRQIAGAVGALHDNSIIHRDLKPSNIMITPGVNGGERAIVMDFGLAKSLTREREIFESVHDFQAGAPFFMAPELLAGDKPSIASDIYALGLIIDEMVTAGGAFQGATVEAILYQKLWGEASDPKTRAAKLPAVWAATIKRCLNRNPAARFGSCAELVQALSRTDESTAPLPNLYRARMTFSQWREPVRRWLRVAKRPAVLASVGALVVAGFVVAGLLGPRSLDTSVLIFDIENLTGKPEYDYLGKELTGELERRLQSLDTVSVYRRYTVRPHNALFKTGERFTVDGTLERGRKSPRLTLSVVEQGTGRVLCCAETFQNEAADSLEMESQMASAAVVAMRMAILAPKPSETHGLWPTAALFLFRNSSFLLRHQVKTGLTDSAAAMDLYMRANVLSDEQTHPALKQAANLYQRALQEDPKFALAYSHLAEVETNQTQFNSAPKQQLFESARAHALQAVAAGPQYAETYAELAVTDQNSWDWKAAERNYKRAIQMNPKLAYVHRWYGGFLIQFGRFDEGIQETRKAIALDPYEYSRRLSLGLYLLYAGRAAEAASVLEQFLGEHDFAVGHENLGLAYAELGVRSKGAERANWFKRGLKEADIVATEDAKYQQPAYAGDAVPMYGLIYALQGDKKQAQRYLNLMLTGSKVGSVGPSELASTYVALGDTASALALLTKGVQDKDSDLLYMKVDPFLEPLRKESTFRALISQAGLN